jgi:iron complex outermembrane receptor protein
VNARRAASRALSFLLAWSLIVEGAIAAQAQADAFEFMAGEAEVLTVNRRPQAIKDAPTSVDVITAEEIRASGAVNLWDLLRSRVGMDVLDSRETGAGSRAIVAVRGFPGDYVNNLQILVDGRSIYNNIFGGVVWGTPPVQLQDVERIEIVRGPNAVLYGSNAAAGVINIITKRPDGDAAVSAGALVGNRGFHRTSAAAESSFSRFDWRASFTNRGEDGFAVPAGSSVGDDYNSNTGNLRGSWHVAENRELESFAGRAVTSAGVPNSRLHIVNDYQMLRLSHGGYEAHGWELMAARKGEEGSIGDSATGLHVDTQQVDVQALHRFPWAGGRFLTVWGGDGRYTRAYSSQLFASAPAQLNRVYRGFVHETFRPASWATLTGGFSWEHSSLGGTEPAYQAAATVEPWTEQTFRLSNSLASTLPTFFGNRADYQVAPGVHISGNPSLNPSRLVNTEAGYRGQFSRRRLEVTETLYQMHVHDLSNPIVSVSPLGAVDVTSVNNDQARARGAETSVTFRFRPGAAVYVNHTYEIIETERRNPAVERGTPRHKVNLGARAPLGGGWSAGLDAGHRTEYRSPAGRLSVARDAFWRLDARLSYALKGAELVLAGQNLTRSQRSPEGSGPDIPRTYYGGLNLHFGGLR